MPASMARWCGETGRLHLGSRGNRGIARSGGRHRRRNRGEFVIVRVIVKVAPFFLLLGQTSVARSSRAIFRHDERKVLTILWKGGFKKAKADLFHSRVVVKMSEGEDKVCRIYKRKTRMKILIHPVWERMVEGRKRFKDGSSELS